MLWLARSRGTLVLVLILPLLGRNLLGIGPAVASSGPVHGMSQGADPATP